MLFILVMRGTHSMELIGNSALQIQVMTVLKSGLEQRQIVMVSKHYLIALLYQSFKSNQKEFTGGFECSSLEF